jgi:hypothetical protein
MCMNSNNSTFFNERIMTAIIQEDENSKTSRRRVMKYEINLNCL